MEDEKNYEDSKTVKTITITVKALLNSKYYQYHLTTN